MMMPIGFWVWIGIIFWIILAKGLVYLTRSGEKVMDIERKMNEQTEKMIKEMAEIWEPWGGPGSYYPDWVKVQRATATITLILSAIEKGEIQLRKVPPKLPGELSRDVTGEDQLMIIIGASQGGQDDQEA